MPFYLVVLILLDLGFQISIHTSGNHYFDTALLNPEPSRYLRRQQEHGLTADEAGKQWLEEYSNN